MARLAASGEEPDARRLAMLASVPHSSPTACLHGVSFTIRSAVRMSVSAPAFGNRIRWFCPIARPNAFRSLAQAPGLLMNHRAAPTRSAAIRRCPAFLWERMWRTALPTPPKRFPAGTSRLSGTSAAVERFFRARMDGRDGEVLLSRLLHVLGDDPLTGLDACSRGVVRQQHHQADVRPGRSTPSGHWRGSDRPPFARMVGAEIVSRPLMGASRRRADAGPSCDAIGPLAAFARKHCSHSLVTAAATSE